jgi:hypothetical protein
MVMVVLFWKKTMKELLALLSCVGELWQGYIVARRLSCDYYFALKEDRRLTLLVEKEFNCLTAL